MHTTAALQKKAEERGRAGSDKLPLLTMPRYNRAAGEQIMNK